MVDARESGHSDSHVDLAYLGIAQLLLHDGPIVLDGVVDVGELGREWNWKPRHRQVIPRALRTF